MIPPAVAAFRADYRAHEIGPRYSGPLHLAFTSTVALAIVIVAALGVHHPTVGEWLVVPAGFLFANLAEWLGHRGVMHRPRARAQLLYKRHTLQHHRFFTDEAMSYEGWRDVKMVLFPWYLIVFFFGLGALPLGIGLWALAGPNAARLFVAVAVGYFLTYEWLHFAYHLAPESLVGRLPGMALLRRHHQRHHAPALMGRWNFNITFPICDLVFGTRWRPPRAGGAATS